MKKIILPAAIIISLLIVASFFDLQIDQNLYKGENSFSHIFSAIGILPQFAIIIFSPAMAICALFVMRRKLNVLLIVSGIIVLIIAVFNFFSGFAVVHEYVNLSSLHILLLYIVCLLVVFFIILPFARKMPREVLIVALIGLLAEFAGSTILAFMKDFWGRRRFFTMDNPAIQFTQWYLPQGKALSDDFKSFPSGHSFAGMIGVWFALFPYFIPTLKKWTKMIFTVLLLFGLATMLSRLICGKHFLSDVTIGGTIALFTLFMAKLLVEKLFANITSA